MSISWHRALFVPRSTAVETSCTVCGRAMWLPASKVQDYRRCSKECIRAHQSAGQDSRRRNCETCGKSFVPRQWQINQGGGRFCAQRCNTAAREALLSPESIAKAQTRRRELEGQGRVRFYSGAENVRWKGGKKACVARRIASGKAAAGLRRYRQNNPDKVREFARRRAGRKLGRLPYGTLPRIRKLQSNRCAICRCSIAKASHLDHILPLARGGRHEPENLQLLCPRCNLTKSDRDPIEHMQSLGRLL